MTARLLKESVRATSWLAGWVDYGVAIVLVAGRLLRIPARAARAEFEPAYIQFASDGYAFNREPRWAEPRRPSQPWFVRPAEIVMLSISFFLAAHLLSGGTASVSAPQLNPLAMLSTTASAGQVSTLLLPSTPSAAPAAALTVTVDPPAEAATSEAAVEQPGAQAPEPIPAAAPESGPSAASVSAEASPVPAEPAPQPAAETAPAPAAEPEPAPAPAAVTAPPPPATATGVLSYSEIMAAAVSAGWPADRLDEVSRVAWCESRFRPDAVGYGTYGLMQLIPFWFETTGTDFALWSDPVTNLRVALFAFATDVEYGNGAWGPWSCKPDQITIP